jgi:putative acetyltransferase
LRFRACEAEAVPLPLRLEVDDLSRPAIAGLLSEHLKSMHALTPAEDAHALDLGALRAPDITFWSAWVGEELAGCGALRELGPLSGEVKSMRTAATYLRQGVAAAVLDEIVAVARRRGYDELLLETGTGPAFAAAHSLYAKRGFEPCEPFGAYSAGPFNRFFRLGLQGSWTPGRC